MSILNNSFIELALRASIASYYKKQSDLSDFLPDCSLITASQLNIKLSAKESFQNGIYSNNNAAILLAETSQNGHKTLIISFRGSSFAQDWIDDYKDVNAHFNNFTKIFPNLIKLSNNYDQVIVSGHSLGGSMAELFMSKTTDEKFLGVTFGAVGILPLGKMEDARVINLMNSHDSVLTFHNRVQFGKDLVESNNSDVEFINGLNNYLAEIRGDPNPVPLKPSELFATYKYMTKDYEFYGSHYVLGGKPLWKYGETPWADFSEHQWATYTQNLNQVLNDDRISFTGTSVAETILGSSADNTFNDIGSGDTVWGGAGSDIYYVSSSNSYIKEFTDEGLDKVISIVSYILAKNIENLDLTSNVNINATGNSLNNSITGNSGANFINGGLGNDTLTGGDGNDTFVFNTKIGPANTDTIIDFATGDKIALSGSIFAKLKGDKDLSDNFKSAVSDKNDYIIYDQATGKLYYDADGSGSKSQAIQIALIGTDTHATLTAADFTII